MATKAVSHFEVCITSATTTKPSTYDCNYKRFLVEYEGKLCRTADTETGITLAMGSTEWDDLIDQIEDHLFPSPLVITNVCFKSISNDEGLPDKWILQADGHHADLSGDKTTRKYVYNKAPSTTVWDDAVDAVKTAEGL